MQDVLLAVPDHYFCYEVAQTGRTTGFDYARHKKSTCSRLIQQSTLPRPRQSSFRIESCCKMFGFMARSCVGGAVPILLLKYRRTLRLHVGVSGTTVGTRMQERQVAATSTCDGDHFQVTNTCKSSVRSMYVWSSRIAKDRSTG